VEAPIRSGRHVDDFVAELKDDRRSRLIGSLPGQDARFGPIWTAVIDPIAYRRAAITKKHPNSATRQIHPPQQRLAVGVPLRLLAAHDANFGVGTHATTVVPLPGVLWMSNFPPNDRILSRILAWPMLGR
jgi:hypothetical protein